MSGELRYAIGNDGQCVIDTRTGRQLRHASHMHSRNPELAEVAGAAWEIEREGWAVLRTQIWLCGKVFV